MSEIAGSPELAISPKLLMSDVPSLRELATMVSFSNLVAANCVCGSKESAKVFSSH